MKLIERLRRGVDTNEAPDKTDAVMAQAADALDLAIKMRAAQNQYFRTRDKNELVACKTLERLFDGLNL
jgi:hypothetical protein